MAYTFVVSRAAWPPEQALHIDFDNPDTGRMWIKDLIKEAKVTDATVTVFDEHGDEIEGLY